MTPEQRTLNVFKELDELLHVPMVEASDNDIEKITNILKWANSNLDKTQLYDFLDKNAENLLYLDLIKDLLETPEFDPSTYH